MTPRQLAVLMAERDLNPSGEDRADMRHAHLVGIVASIAGGGDGVSSEDALAHFLQFVNKKRDRKRKAIGPAAAAKMVAGAIGGKRS